VNPASGKEDRESALNELSPIICLNALNGKTELCLDEVAKMSNVFVNFGLVS